MFPKTLLNSTKKLLEVISAQEWDCVLELYDNFILL